MAARKMQVITGWCAGTSSVEVPSGVVQVAFAIGQPWARALPNSRPKRCMFHRKAALSWWVDASRRFNSSCPAMPGCSFRMRTEDDMRPKYIKVFSCGLA